MISDEQPFVPLVEDAQLAADVVDVVLEQQDAGRERGTVVLELVQVEPLEQLLVDFQLQVGELVRGGGLRARRG